MEADQLVALQAFYREKLHAQERRLLEEHDERERLAELLLACRYAGVRNVEIADALNDVLDEPGMHEVAYAELYYSAQKVTHLMEDAAVLAERAVSRLIRGSGAGLPASDDDS